MSILTVILLIVFLVYGLQNAATQNSPEDVTSVTFYWIAPPQPQDIAEYNALPDRITFWYVQSPYVIWIIHDVQLRVLLSISLLNGNLKINGYKNFTIER